jgi:hypothetical protein
VRLSTEGGRSHPSTSRRRRSRHRRTLCRGRVPQTDAARAVPRQVQHLAGPVIQVDHATPPRPRGYDDRRAIRDLHPGIRAAAPDLVRLGVERQRGGLVLVEEELRQALQGNRQVLLQKCEPALSEVETSGANPGADSAPRIPSASRRCSTPAGGLRINKTPPNQLCL